MAESYSTAKNSVDGADDASGASMRRGNVAKGNGCRKFNKTAMSWRRSWRRSIAVRERKLKRTEQDRRKGPKDDATNKTRFQIENRILPSQPIVSSTIGQENSVIANVVAKYMKRQMQISIRSYSRNRANQKPLND